MLQQWINDCTHWCLKVFKVNSASECLTLSHSNRSWWPQAGMTSCSALWCISAGSIFHWTHSWGCLPCYGVGVHQFVWSAEYRGTHACAKKEKKILYCLAGVEGIRPSLKMKVTFLMLDLQWTDDQSSLLSMLIISSLTTPQWKQPWIVTFICHLLTHYAVRADRNFWGKARE